MHTRKYDVQVLLIKERTLRAIGVMRDVKPAGLYTQNDPEDLPIHHMELSIDVDLETLKIIDANCDMLVHPMVGCPSITQRYRELIGVSITRGFNRFVRSTFGGPKGCTHTTALLSAMAPAVVQSMWSVRVFENHRAGRDAFSHEEAELELSVKATVNSCHMWDENGEHVARMRRNEPSIGPMWMIEREVKLGRRPASDLDLLRE